MTKVEKGGQIGSVVLSNQRFTLTDLYRPWFTLVMRTI